MWPPPMVAYAGWVSTMADVGGRVREGKPPKLWSNFGHDLKTPATGAVDYSNAPRIPPGRDTAACFSPAGNKSYCKVSYIQHALMAASVGSVSRATAASSLPVTQVESSTQNGYQFASETFRIRLAQKTLKQQRRSARKPIPPKQKNLQKSSKNRARVTQSEGRMHQKCSQN